MSLRLGAIRIDKRRRSVRLHGVERERRDDRRGIRIKDSDWKRSALNDDEPRGGVEVEALRQDGRVGSKSELPDLAVLGIDAHIVPAATLNMHVWVSTATCEDTGTGDLDRLCVFIRLRGLAVLRGKALPGRYGR